MTIKTKLTLILITGLLLGIIPAIWITQNNRQVTQATLHAIIKMLEKSWNAKVTIKESRANLFTGIIDLDYFKIESKHKVGCSILAEKGRLHILQSSLHDGRVNLHIELVDIDVKTNTKDGELGLMLLLQKIFLFQSKNFVAQSFLLKNVSLSVKKAEPSVKAKPSVNENLVTATYAGELLIKKVQPSAKDNQSRWHGRGTIGDGTIKIGEKMVLEALNGTVQFDQGETDKDPPAAKIDFSFTSPYVPYNKQVTLSGVYNTATKSLFVKNKDESVVSNVTFVNNVVQADLCVSMPNDGKITGKGRWDLGTKKQFPGEYEVTLVHDTLVVPVTGRCKVGRNSEGVMQVQTSGTTPYAKYLVVIDFNKEKPLSKLILMHKGRRVGSFTQQSSNRITGSIAYHFVQALLPLHLRKMLLGNRGTIGLDLTMHDLQTISGEVKFSDGKLHVPGNYNLITGAAAALTVDGEKKRCTLRDLVLTLQKGTILCDHTTVHWNDQYDLAFLHTHVVAKECLVNWKDDFFCFITSSMLIQKELNGPLRIDGDVVIQRSLIKDNILAAQQEGIPSQRGTPSQSIPRTDKNDAVCLNLSISNQDDLVINTPFVQAKATADLRVNLNACQNTLITPQLQGSVNIRQGALTFPKNRLFISSGSVTFIPTQLNNPMIHLVAKNRIKKYLISLMVSGPLQKPTIFLESNPELTEEQIIALLFAGSETINIQAELPTIIMQNLHLLIFGNKKTLPPARRFFHALTQPLKYIQITPDFTDQAGRGGMKGTISIDVNKQLHAQIQKNFTLQDDLAFQLEYFLSDDFNIKVIRDYREDLGAQIEMVYKP